MHLEAVARRDANIAKFGVMLERERGLLLAILERAINDALGLVACGTYSQIGRLETIAEAREWLGLQIGGGNMDELEPFSFPWVCDHLELCPKKVIKWMLKEQKRLLH